MHDYNKVVYLVEDRIYLSPPYICGNEQKYVDDVFLSNWIAPLGPQVSAFEADICAYTGVPHALATSSGSAAIHLALRYFGVDAGDIVFCSSFTFAGSCFPILYQDAKPVFIDSEPNSLNMSPDALEKAFKWATAKGKLPKAVIIVDLYGWSADYDKLLPICREYGVPVIEDAAEALGSFYKGRACGSFGDVSIFSFNGNKIVTTSGGGMAISHNDAMITKMLYWATQARESEIHYEHLEYGYNYRLSNVCAAIGRGQLEGLAWKIARRKEIYEIYYKLFNNANAPVQVIPVDGKGAPNYWLSVATIDIKKATPHDVCRALNTRNIEARPLWKPMHMQPVFKECIFFPHDPEVCPNLFKTGICLPSGEKLTIEQQELITSIIIDIVTKG